MPPYAEAQAIHPRSLSHSRAEVPPAAELFGSSTLAASAATETRPSVGTQPRNRSEGRTYANGRRRRPDNPQVPFIDPIDKSLQDRTAAIDVTGQDAALLGRGGLQEVPESLRGIVSGVVPREVGSVVLQAAATYSGEQVSGLRHKAAEIDRRRSRISDAGALFDSIDSLQVRTDAISSGAYTAAERDAAHDSARVLTAQGAVETVLAERGATAADIHHAHELTGIVTGMMIERANIEGLPGEEPPAPRPENVQRRQSQWDLPPTSRDYTGDYRTVGSPTIHRMTKELVGAPEAKYVIKKPLTNVQKA